MTKFKGQVRTIEELDSFIKSCAEDVGLLDVLFWNEGIRIIVNALTWDTEDEDIVPVEVCNRSCHITTWEKDEVLLSIFTSMEKDNVNRRLYATEYLVFDVECWVNLDSTDKVKELIFELMYKDLS
jgi:hypothetical protein